MRDLFYNKVEGFMEISVPSQEKHTFKNVEFVRVSHNGTTMNSLKVAKGKESELIRMLSEMHIGQDCGLIDPDGVLGEDTEYKVYLEGDIDMDIIESIDKAIGTYE